MDPGNAHYLQLTTKSVSAQGKTDRAGNKNLALGGIPWLTREVI
jgi:hypothetical protein